MLSYRHAFHAGNHADVLKHTVLVHCLRYLTLKEKAVLYLDTHSGTGFTNLYRSYAGKNKEYLEGISKLYGQHFGLPFIDQYVAAVRQRQESRALKIYPGSVALAHDILRPQDRMCLAEMHPQDYDALSRFVKRQEKSKRMWLYSQDGFSLPRELFPPVSRRALVLIDPSYEVKTDYDKTLQAVKEILKRLHSATVIVWIPMVARKEAQDLAERLLKCHPNFVSCKMQLKNAEIHSLYGSTVYVANPPYTLIPQLQQSLPALSLALGGKKVRYDIKYNSL